MLNPHNLDVNEMHSPGGVARSTVGLWRWRRLIVALARREFRAHYAGSVLGAAWAILEPAVQFGLYLVLFSVLLGMRLESTPSVGSFGLYLVGGLVPFMALQEGVVRAASFARANASLMRHVQVPIEVLLAGSLVAVMARHALAFGLVLIAGTALGSVVPAQLLWLLLGFPLLVLGTWGAALGLVVAGAFLPDLTHVLGTAMTVVFFLSPIVYPETALPAAVVPWLAANPVVGLLDTFRSGLMGAPVTAVRLGVTVVAAATIFFFGSALFARKVDAVRDIV